LTSNSDTKVDGNERQQHATSNENGGGNHIALVVERLHLGSATNV
jgi:hypothetical protein